MAPAQKADTRMKYRHHDTVLAFLLYAIMLAIGYKVWPVINLIRHFIQK